MVGCAGSRRCADHHHQRRQPDGARRHHRHHTGNRRRVGGLDRGSSRCERHCQHRRRQHQPLRPGREYRRCQRQCRHLQRRHADHQRRQHQHHRRRRQRCQHRYGGRHRPGRHGSQSGVDRCFGRRRHHQHGRHRRYQRPDQRYCLPQRHRHWHQRLAGSLPRQRRRRRPQCLRHGWQQCRRRHQCARARHLDRWRHDDQFASGWRHQPHGYWHQCHRRFGQQPRCHAGLQREQLGRLRRVERRRHQHYRHRRVRRHGGQCTERRVHATRLDHQRHRQRRDYRQRNRANRWCERFSWHCCEEYEWRDERHWRRWRNRQHHAGLSGRWRSRPGQRRIAHYRQRASGHAGRQPR